MRRLPEPIQAVYLRPEPFPILNCIPFPMSSTPKVTGVGGVFFKSDDPKALNAWYADRLGIEMSEWGASFDWKDSMTGDGNGQTAFNIFKSSSDYYPGRFMINFRVQELEGLVALLREKGDRVDEKGIESYSYGKFAWVYDPDGNKIELWEPIDDGFSEA